MALTQRQKAFAKHLALGLTATEAARAAGYSDSSPQGLRVGASRLQHHPDIQREAHAQRERRLQGTMASKALATLEHVLDSPDSPAAAKVQAARWILEASGHGIEAAKLLHRIGDADERVVSQLSAADLEALVLAATDKVRFERAAAIEAEVIVSIDDVEE